MQGISQPCGLISVSCAMDLSRLLGEMSDLTILIAIPPAVEWRFGEADPMSCFLSNVYDIPSGRYSQVERVNTRFAISPPTVTSPDIGFPVASVPVKTSLPSFNSPNPSSISVRRKNFIETLYPFSALLITRVEPSSRFSNLPKYLSL